MLPILTLVQLVRACVRAKAICAPKMIDRGDPNSRFRVAAYVLGGYIRPSSMAFHIQACFSRQYST